LATSESEAVELARELGYPLVAKVVSPDVLHKTDLGGVVLDISNETQVGEAFRTIVRSVREKSLSARVNGILLERMEPEGIEVIAGATNDPQFGKVVAFGLGGIFVETYADVAFRLVPISRMDAESMVKEIRGAAVFAGARGGKRVDPEVILTLITAVSRMADELDDVEQIDLNPAILRGDQATVVDARFLLARESRTKREHLPIASLERFFNAQSVAVIGASSTPGKIGHEILAPAIRRL
jgi:acyl-CoA synthetase (NDP forming)